MVSSDSQVVTSSAENNGKSVDQATPGIPLVLPFRLQSGQNKIGIHMHRKPENKTITENRTQVLGNPYRVLYRYTTDGGKATGGWKTTTPHMDTHNREREQERNIYLHIFDAHKNTLGTTGEARSGYSINCDHNARAERVKRACRGSGLGGNGLRLSISCEQKETCSADFQSAPVPQRNKFTLEPATFKGKGILLLDIDIQSFIIKGVTIVKAKDIGAGDCTSTKLIEVAMGRPYSTENRWLLRLKSSRMETTGSVAQRGNGLRLSISCEQKETCSADFQSAPVPQRNKFTLEPATFKGKGILLLDIDIQSFIIKGVTIVKAKDIGAGDCTSTKLIEVAMGRPYSTENRWLLRLKSSRMETTGSVAQHIVERRIKRTPLPPEELHVDGLNQVMTCTLQGLTYSSPLLDIFRSSMTRHNTVFSPSHPSAASDPLKVPESIIPLILQNSTFVAVVVDDNFRRPDGLVVTRHEPCWAALRYSEGTRSRKEPSMPACDSRLAGPRQSSVEIANPKFSGPPDPAGLETNPTGPGQVEKHTGLQSLFSSHTHEQKIGPIKPIYVPLLGTGLLSEQEGLGHSSHAGPVRIGNFARTIESLRRFLEPQETIMLSLDYDTLHGTPSVYTKCLGMNANVTQYLHKVSLLMAFLGLDELYKEKERRAIMLGKKKKPFHKPQLLMNENMQTFTFMILAGINMLFMLTLPLAVLKEPCEAFKKCNMLNFYAFTVTVKKYATFIDRIMILMFVALVIVGVKTVLDAIAVTKINLSPWLEQGKYVLPGRKCCDHKVRDPAKERAEARARAKYYDKISEEIYKQYEESNGRFFDPKDALPVLMALRALLQDYMDHMHTHVAAHAEEGEVEGDAARAQPKNILVMLSPNLDTLKLHLTVLSHV
ncbi:hypothetical protein MSG28_011994 [Choristoneura fumiferana]|uniref:Uncharacterized protein n=1 Tax=Choristoneura fumiferana TaxID=7141 RepID=A0ACC0KN91_CHOFU|nr:hypothetical protein MSG28_011994 [Choristoneura fumiferana]